MNALNEFLALADSCAVVAVSYREDEEVTVTSPKGDPATLEVLIHRALGFPYVLQVAPPALTGVLAGNNRAARVTELLGERAYCLPVISPGDDLTDLTAEIAETVSSHRRNYGSADSAPPLLLFLGHIGLFVAGDSAETVIAACQEAVAAVEGAVRSHPVTEPLERDSDRLVELSHAVRRALADTRAAHGSALNAPVTTACTNPEILRRAASADAFVPLRRPLMTDQLLHLGHAICFVDRQGPRTSPLALQADVLHAVHDFIDAEDALPRVVVAQDIGAVMIADEEHELAEVCAAFHRLVDTAFYSEHFGGPRTIPAEFVVALEGLLAPAPETT